MIHVHESPGETRIALVRAGRLTEYLLHRPASPDGIGDVHIARVTAKIPAMAGAFVALRGAEGFMPDTQGAASLGEGDHIPVRITRAAQGGKGPRVALCRDEAGAGVAGPVRLLRRGPSPLEELQDAYPTEALQHGAFDDALEAEIEALGEPAAILEGGLRAIVSPTPALTAIDVDAGAATAARAPKAAAQMNTNRAAIPDLVRQIVLRNLSGAIVIDFAGIPSRKRPSLGPILEAALATDRLGPRLAGFSPLGFAEILRPRRRPPLHEVLTTPLGLGLAALRQAVREAQAAPGRHLALRASPAVVAALQAEPEALGALARLVTYPLVLRGDPALTRAWFIEDDGA